MGPIKDRAADTPLTKDFCVAASCGLIEALKAGLPEVSWRIAGGPFREQSGGMLDMAGDRKGHFWPEGILTDGRRIIVDVTADQFGHAPLIAEYAPDPRYLNALPEDWKDEDVSSEAERGFGRLIVEDMEFADQLSPFEGKPRSISNG